MKVSHVLFFALICCAAACKKEAQITDSTPIVLAATDTVVYSGSFTNGQHSVSGDAKIIKSAGNKRFLVLGNLKTEAGPDLRVRLATDRTNATGVELSASVKNGNAKLEIPASINIATHKSALIWCQQYSVLFGSVDMR
jgi:hypothetical protein